MNNNPHIAAISRIESLFANRKLFWNTINATMHKKMLGIAGIDWHPAVFIPVSVWMEVFNKDLKNNLSGRFALDIKNEADFVAILCSLMSVVSWRYTQGSYMINSYVRDNLFCKNQGSVISAEHINNLCEWTSYILLEDVYLANKKVHGVFCHKNNYANFGKATPPDILILTFNTDQDSPRANGPMPYVILNTKTNQTIESSILTFGGIDSDVLIEFVSPIMSLVNLLGDLGTSIETEVTGVNRPHYQDVAQNINFSELNIPTFKLSAPSNMRILQVGVNHMTHHKKLVRQNRDSPILDIHWSLHDDGLKLNKASFSD